jgi:hypothetical protein
MAVITTDHRKEKSCFLRYRISKCNAEFSNMNRKRKETQNISARGNSFIWVSVFIEKQKEKLLRERKIKACEECNDLNRVCQKVVCQVGCLKQNRG